MLNGHYSSNPIYWKNLVKTHDVVTKSLHEELKWEHPGIELVYAKNNPQKIGFRNKQQTLAPKCLAVYNGREPHSDIHEEENSYYGIIISNQFTSSLLSDLSVNPDEIIFTEAYPERSEQIKNQLDFLFRLRTVPDIDTMTIESVLADLLIHLFSDVKNNLSWKLKKLEAQKTYPSIFEKARHLIYENVLNSNFNLSQLAQDLQISKFYLVRGFRSKFGLSPMKYRNQLRIDLAKESLLNNRNDITSTAFSLGFNDLSAFNKRFVQMVGKNPTQYLKLFKRT